MITTDREKYINHLASRRELREAIKEYYGPDGIPSESPEEMNRKMAACMNWYNTERKLVTTGLTPQEMFDKGTRSSLDHPIELAYGLVYDAIGYLNNHTPEDDQQGLKLIARALELDPDNEEAMYIYCDMHFDGGNTEQIMPYVDRLLEMGGNRPFVYLWKAFSLMFGIKKRDGRTSRKTKLEKAMGYAEKALELDAENFDAVTVCAQITYWLDDNRHRQFVEKMFAIDSNRAKQFMDKQFIYERNFL